MEQLSNLQIMQCLFTVQHQTVLDSACFILSYIADILGALKQLLDRQVEAAYLIYSLAHPYLIFT